LLGLFELQALAFGFKQPLVKLGDGSGHGGEEALRD
jgi:hypothetical protein